MHRQFAPISAILGRLCSNAQSDPLTGLVEHLLQHAIPTMSLEPLHQWLARFGSPLMPGIGPPRLRVVRLTLDRDPRDARAMLVRHAAVVEPPIPDLDRYLPDLPVSVANLGQLYDLMTRLMNSLGPALVQASASARETGKPHSWREFVLDIEAPDEIACEDFEFACPNRPGRKLLNHFRCITVRPLYGYEVIRPLRGVDCPVFHPRHNKNSVAVWETNEPEYLYQAAQGRDCLFTGPMALGCGDGVPAIVQAFEGYPSAIVCQADHEAEALEPLFDGEEQRYWPELLDRVTMLRLKGGRLKVLWNDPSYDLVLADSL